MRKTTIYRFHTQDKTYVFADKRTPEQIIEYYTIRYERRKAVKNFQGFRYELFEHQIPDITAIEEYEGTNDDIRSRVKHYREQFNCITLNPDIIAKQARLSLEWEEENRKRAKQYYHDNKEKVAAREKKYRQENKEILATRAKKYRQKNKEKINARERERYQKNKEKIAIRAKKYRQENKEKVATRERKYRQENKEKINAKIPCECGAIVSKRYMPRHKNTNKHKNNMPVPEKKEEKKEEEKEIEYRVYVCPKCREMFICLVCEREKHIRFKHRTHCYTWQLGIDRSGREFHICPICFKDN